MNWRRIAITIGGAALAALLVSCQAVFTYSPLSQFQRNPATMSSTQKVAYAQSALTSGDPKAMAKAYDLIKNSSNPQTNALAGQLAFGASGATDALTKVLADVASGTTPTDIQPILSSVNVTLVTDGAANILKAQTGGATVTDSERAIAAAALVVSAAKQSNVTTLSGLSNITSSDPGYQNLQDAKTLASSINSPDIQSVLKQMNL